jgi:excisionase family DNA binding protein
MTDDWLTAKQAGEMLGCETDAIYEMLGANLLQGHKENRQWQINKADVEALLDWVDARELTPALEHQPATMPVESGMVEVSMALGGLAATITAFLPGLTNVYNPYLVIMATFFSGVLAMLSCYSALWLLARYYLEESARLGFEVQRMQLDNRTKGCVRWFGVVGLAEIAVFLRHPTKRGPYWILALALLVWLWLSFFIGAVLTLVRLVS